MSVRPPSPPPSPGADPLLDTTAVLLERVRGGDATARERLFARVMPALTRWAHQRLPARARDLADTGDVVQITVSRALARLEHFEHRGEGAFLGYLRHILFNVIRDESRRAGRRPGTTALDETVPDPAPSLLERTVSRDLLDRYERALAALDAESREAVLLRVEFGYSHAQIAEATGRPSPDAARMTVARAMLAIARSMGKDARDD